MKTLKTFENFVNESVGNFELKKVARNLYSVIKKFGFKLEINLEGDLGHMYSQHGNFVAKSPVKDGQVFKTPIQILVDESGKNKVSEGQPVCAIIIPKDTIANRDDSNYLQLAQQKAQEINNGVKSYLKDYPTVETLYNDYDWCFVIFLRVKSKTKPAPPVTPAGTPAPVQTNAPAQAQVQPASAKPTTSQPAQAQPVQNTSNVKAS